MSNPMIPSDSELDGTIEEIQIEQDHQRGPGLFLKIAYICIAIFMVYYFFAHKDWKSDYEKHMETEEAQIEQVTH
jgi:hypothetical protein